MPERIYDMDVCGSLMVVATAGNNNTSPQGQPSKQVLVYNVGGPTPVEHSRKDSPLKYQTRCVSCFPDQTGFAIGSIEGRVGIQYVQKPPGKDHFAFKCHRNGNDVYSVNAIAFNNAFGTFATCGSDGVVTFWDKGECLWVPPCMWPNYNFSFIPLTNFTQCALSLQTTSNASKPFSPFRNPFPVRPSIPKATCLHTLPATIGVVVRPLTLLRLPTISTCT